MACIPAQAAEADLPNGRTLLRSISDLLRSDTDVVGYPILPLVHQIAKQCGDAGRYVHWGATTQDIMDTAVVLQVRARPEIIERDIAALRGILVGLARRLPRHADARSHPPAAGAAGDVRLHSDAIWLAMFDRHAERLIQLKPRRAGRPVRRRRRYPGSLGDKGFEVQQALCEELGLGVPVSTWHVARDGLAEAMNFLAAASPDRSARSRSTS